ncbi:hypothetical protein EI94DRAFT_1750118 [Lactarius quietus]|nr:hypothetical protein EI94DRAFT_1750118 [Lactarius quietus]
MIVGRFAFRGLSGYLTWQKIKQLDYTFPEGFDPEAADLVRRLLDTLWDEPAPQLKTDLVRRERAPADEWDNMGATWDELVGPDGSDDEDEDDGSSEGPHAHAHVRIRAPGDDGIEWAPNAQTYLSPSAIPPEEIGPHGETPDYAREALSLLGAINSIDAVDGTMSAGGDAEDARGKHTVGAAVSGTHEIQNALPGINGVSKNTGPGAGAIADSAATDEATDSGVCPGPGNGPGPGLGKDKDEEEASQVSSTTEVGDAEGAAALGEEPPHLARRWACRVCSSDGSPVEKLSAELEAMGTHRGGLLTRDTLPATSVEAVDCYAAPSFSQMPSLRENILFHAPVGETVLKRRTSRLLPPLPNGRGVGIKAEFGLREAQASATGREKRPWDDEVRGMITGVERKSAKEFFVMTWVRTDGQVAFFIVESEAAADAGLQQHSTQNRERKQSSNNNNNVSAIPRT